jgi:hypothetical protein
METPSEGKPNGNGKSPQGKVTLREIQNKPQSTAGGAFALRAAYLADRIHKGSDVWINVIAPKEREWAGHFGYESLEDAPIDFREYAHLWIANWLLAAYYMPKGNPRTIKEVRAALNSLERMTREMMNRKREKPVNPALGEVIEIEQVSPAGRSGK